MAGKPSGALKTSAPAVDPDPAAPAARAAAAMVGPRFRQALQALRGCGKESREDTRKARSASGARTSSPGSPGSRTTRSRRAASTRRDGSQAASKADGAYQAAPPKNRIAKYGGVKKGRTRVSVPAPAFRCLGQAAAGIREMDWNKLYRALEILTRFLIPCESVSLYLVEEGGRYLRRVNTFLESFPPERRGHLLTPVSESTVEGAAAVHAEPCGLPVRAKVVTKTQVEWASREATGLYPLPSKGTFQDLSAGASLAPYPPADWTSPEAPTVTRIRNVLAFPLLFGSSQEDDPFGDYASADTEHALADERVFAVLKLTNRLSKGNGRAPVNIAASSRDRADLKYQPFAKRDSELLEAMSEFLREVYFSIDPVTFGPRASASLDVREEIEPLNAPSMMSGPSRSNQSGSRAHNQSGSRLLSHVQSGGSAASMAAGMFGILGNAFAKGSSQKRRAAELPDLLQKPEVQVTSDSSESMRAAPGWVYKDRA
ncbi:unnamed protein product [Effrenium voratum]|uniref:Uncharacterized protein n=1 Tax=Effrenium voratum TaxID=2562239 RepID=A0AA36IR85_9DINO|nr:unnamed protein product [Effrenium voratum]